jgi:PAS domain S-box-containing protein
MKQLNLDTIEHSFFKEKNPWKKLLAISLDLLDAKQSGILYGTNESRIKFLPTNMWDRGIMDKLNGRGVSGFFLRLFGKYIVAARKLSPVFFYKFLPGGERQENDGIIAYVLRHSVDYYKKGINIIICPDTSSFLNEAADINGYNYVPFFIYDGIRINRHDNGIKVDTRIVKHFKSNNSIYIILPDYGILVLNTADVGLMEVCDNHFVKEKILRERLDLLIKLVETSSLGYLGQLKGKKGAELLWRKEVHLRKTYLNLVEKEREYRDLYENAPISYLSMDRVGTIYRCNQQACLLSGYDKHELMGLNVLDLFANKKQPDQNFDSIWQTLKVGGAVKDMEFEMVCKNGNRVWISLSIDAIKSDAIKNKNDNIVEIRAMGMDISQRKILEKQLFHAQKMEAIGTLARGIAHDFNNVLSPISGYAQMMLMDDTTRGVQKEQIGIILECARHAKDLVNQILTFSRQKEHDRILVKAGNAVADAMDLVSNFLPSSIKISTVIDPGCGYIMADPIQINQLMMNLVTNACHAMEQGGGKLDVLLERVEITPSTPGKAEIKPGAYVCLCVKDTGYGIEKEVLPHIFEPYFSTKVEGKGSGIGLSVVHGIVKTHGGYIQVESCKGKGTKFLIYFPVCRSRGEAWEETRPDLAVEFGTEQILLVDDDKKVAIMHTHMLERLGYGVTCFTDSPTALSVYAKNPKKFDLVITDLTMPDLSGFDLANQLVQINPDLPIILCTGLGDSIERGRKDAGCVQGFLTKPVEIKALSFTLRRLLDKDCL